MATQVTYLTNVLNRLAALEAATGVFESENKAGSTIRAGMVCAVHSSGIGAVLADASGISKAAIGLMRSDTLDTHVGPIQFFGPMTLADWTNVTGTTTLAAKATYFSDPANPGMLTTSAPSAAGQCSQIVGESVSDDTLEIKIGSPIKL